MVARCLHCKKSVEANVFDLRGFNYCPYCGKEWDHEFVRM